jgi:hypothetical protein
MHRILPFEMQGGFHTMSVVSFVCVREGGKLRVRITSPGYYADANCQFPRAIRAPGATFTAPADAVTLAAGPQGRYYYRVTPSAITVGANAFTGRIFTDPDPACIICLDAAKQVVGVPCGHYALCAPCSSRVGRRCPICRTEVTAFVDRSLIG